jgi:hypothetical protein
MISSKIGKKPKLSLINKNKVLTQNNTHLKHKLRIGSLPKLPLCIFRTHSRMKSRSKIMSKDLRIQTLSSNSIKNNKSFKSKKGNSRNYRK